jgi:hypothetical protein
MTTRREIEHKIDCAREARQQAALLAPGKVRDALMEKVKQYEAEIRAPIANEDRNCDQS